jgi:hypothetical protein
MEQFNVTEPDPNVWAKAMCQTMAEYGFNPNENGEWLAMWIEQAMAHGHDRALRESPLISSEAKDSYQEFGPCVVQHQVGTVAGESIFDKELGFLYVAEEVRNSAGVVVNHSTIVIPRERIITITPVPEGTNLAGYNQVQPPPQRQLPIPPTFTQHHPQPPPVQHQLPPVPPPPPVQPVFHEIKTYDPAQMAWVTERVQVNAPPPRIEGSTGTIPSQWMSNPTQRDANGRPIYVNENLDRHPDEGGFSAG